MANESVVQKIQKLFAMTSEKGCTEAEAASAVERAYALMEKHHLTEADLVHEPEDDYKKVDKSNFEEARCYVSGSFFLWETQLATFVSEFVGCPVYIDHVKRTARHRNGMVKLWKGDPWKGKSIVFFGVAEDSNMAADIYEELRLLIIAMAGARYGKAFRGDGAAYSEGFVLGLFSKIRDAKASEKRLANSTGLTLIARRNDLVKYKSDKAFGWLEKEKGIKLGRGSSRGGAGNSSETREARNSGFVDGKNTDVNGTKRKKLV